MLLKKQKESFKIFLGKKVKLEDSEDEEDQDFIQKLLKDTEVKKAGT